MLEIVYSGKEAEDVREVRIPKNIRQVGSSNDSKKIYIEDYVMNSIKKLPECEDGVKYGVLLGDVKKSKDISYIFVRGMVETREIIENSVIFNDDIWANIYKDAKNYFEGLEIVGWFVSLPYTVKNELSSLQKIHMDNFAGNDKVCFLYDRTENDEGFFRYDSGNLKKESGYYIFYEKNEPMKKYLKMTGGSRGLQIKEEKQENVAEDKPEIKKIGLREMLKKEINDSVEKPSKLNRLSYGISSVLIIALLLSTVVMLNNYGELKNLKNSIDTMNSDDNIQAVNEILSSIMPTTHSAEETTINLEDATTTQETGDIEEQYSEISETAEEANVQIEEQEVLQDQEEETEYQVEYEANYEEEEYSTDYQAASMYSGTYHQVELGQTLYDISIKYYGDSSMVESIKELNGIDDDYLIKEGDSLLLP